MSEEQLKEITEFAADYLSLEEIAEVMEVDKAEFKREFEEKRDLYKAIRKGRLLTKSTVQRALITQAKNGSNPAQEKLLKLISRIENNEI